MLVDVIHRNTLYRPTYGLRHLDSSVYRRLITVHLSHINGPIAGMQLEN